MAKREKAAATVIRFRANAGLAQRLEEAAERNRRTLSDEVRTRLEMTLAASYRPAAAVDAATRTLLEQITALAENLPAYYGEWSKDRFSYEAFVAALGIIIKALPKPAGEPIPKPTEFATFLGLGPDTSAEEVGRFLAAIVLRPA